jgi:alpha-tubulin suppressor-like RCC1 family protein
MWIWGRGTQGQLGDNDTNDRSSPVQVGSPGGFIGGNAAPRASYGIKSDNTLWTWGGNNNYGTLGLNSETQYSSPMQVPGSWTSAIGSGGENAAMGVKTSGELFTWGSQDYGGLGQNNNTKYISPAQVGTDTTWATGFDKYYMQGHTTWAIKTDGTLWCMGYAGWNSLGLNNSSEHRSSPTQVGTATNWSVVGRNYGSNNAVINEDGELWVCGSGGYGALGLNNTSPSGTLTQLPGTTWKCQSGVDDGMLATKTDGTMWTWGRNANGELGHNSTTQYSSPKQVPGTTWDRVVSGSGAVVASKTDGTLWTWGYNRYGELGQNQGGPSARLSSPVQLGTDTDWVSNEKTFSGIFQTAFGFKHF